MTKWTPEEDALFTRLCAEGKHRYQDMLPLFPRLSKVWQFATRARQLGIMNTHVHQRRYTYNVNYFNEPTLESSYWAGILQTDGCILYRNDRPAIIWGCASKDRSHMEAFRAHIASDHPIHEGLKKCKLSTKDPNQGHLNCRITFEGAFEWAAALKQHYGFDHNKTLRTTPPALPSRLHELAFIRGCVDGDGTITSSPQNGAISIRMCGSNRELLLWMKGLVDSLDLPQQKRYVNTTSVVQHKGESCYYWGLSGFQAAVFHELMMRLPTPFIARKWQSPKPLAAKAYWMSRADIWPPESFFANILGRP